MILKIHFVIGFVFFINHVAIAQKAKFLVIGHRGAMGYETENTIRSIQKAIALHVDMIEIDVFKTKDNQIVVFHDEKLKRLTKEEGQIEDKTLAEIKKLRLADGQQIPTLIEVLKCINGRVPINIELKGSQTAKLTMSLVNAHYKNPTLKQNKVLISSFKWNELAQTRALDATIQIAVLTEDDPVEAISFAQKIKAVAINPNYKNLDRNKVRAIHEQGFKVYPWTVNKVKDIKKMQNMGVDGIFCNFPDNVTKPSL